MSPSDQQRFLQLENEVAQLRQQMAELQAERGRARLRRWARAAGKRPAVLVTAVVAAISLGSLSWAATSGCPNGLPVCFLPNTPALAGDVNLDLSTLKDWIETKVGAVSTGNVTIAGTTTHTAQVNIRTGTSSNASILGNKPLVVTGPISDGVNDLTNGVEFRHDNLTQGVGIGYAGIYATGSNPTQDLYLQARGNGVVVSKSTFETFGELRGNTIRQRGCNWGAAGPSVNADNQTHQVFCPSGTFMAGWRCDATDRLDGNCAAYCCYP